MRLNKSLVLIASALLLASCNKPTEVKPMPPIHEQGEEKVFYKLLEFDSDETGKHYLAYTDNETDEKGS